MRTTNKPYVFLSHSALDKPFIEKLALDLRKCDIDPWLDTESIPDGKPWMDEIFQNGISVCDAILTYYTDNSLASQMVKREVNSAILRQLNDGKVAFLPYVDSKQTRSKLRIDIQSLQCRVWNEDNYQDILPSIVSSIWRSYTERSVYRATLEEKNRRMEAELRLTELEKPMESSIFSSQEEQDFSYIFSQLSHPMFIDVGPIHVPGSYQGDSKIYFFGKPQIHRDGNIYTFPETYDRLAFFPIEALVRVIESGISDTDKHEFLKAAYDIVSPRSFNNLGKETIWAFRDDIDFLELMAQMRIFSLTNMEAHQSSHMGSLQTRWQSVFSDKMYRFVYWIRYSKLLNDHRS